MGEMKKCATLIVTQEVKSYIEFTSDPEGAAIFIDGNDTGMVTPATIAVDPGEHTWKLTLEGYKEETGTITVEEGETETVSVTLESEVPSKPVSKKVLLTLAGLGGVGALLLLRGEKKS